VAASRLFRTVDAAAKGSRLQLLLLLPSMVCLGNQQLAQGLFNDFPNPFTQVQLIRVLINLDDFTGLLGYSC
jgi:hypothetical protein